MSPEGKYRLVPYALLVLAVCLLYGNTLSGGFVWDDNLFTSNQIYWSFDFRKIFFSLANGLEYQPIRDLTYLFDIAVWRGSSFGFHLTNLLLFVAIVILAYRVAEEISFLSGMPDAAIPGWFVPFFTATLFAVHPLKSEVVAWITQRNTLLAALFSFISILCFLRYLEKNDKKIFAFSLAAFFLAILSKAIVVTLPLLLMFFMLAKKGGGWRQVRFWPPLVPFFILSGAGAILHVAIARKTTVISATYYGSLSERLSVALQIPFFYLKKALLPTDLSAFYAEDFARQLISSRVLVSSLMLAALAAAAWLSRKKCPEILLGGGWFFITLLPFSNLLATSPVAADRYLFIPSFGLAFAAVSLVGRIRLPLKMTVSILVLVICLSVPVTFRQNSVWHDNVALWSRTSERAPQVAGVWFNLGRAWHGTTQLSMALEAYLRAVKLDPSDTKPLDNAASLFPSSRGSIAVRHELVRSLVEQMPDYPGGLALIGYTDAEWKHPDAAEELFLYLLEAEKRSLTLRLCLANLYRKVGAFDRSVQIYSEIADRGEGRGEAEFGLAAIAASNGNQPEKARLIALAKVKGGVPAELIAKLEKK